MAAASATYGRYQYDTGVCEKNTSSGEEGPQEDWLSEHQVRGWNAFSAAGLLGQGSGSVCSQTPL